MSNKLAILGGEKTIKQSHNEIFKWPIITEEDKKAVLDVLDRCAMSGTDVTVEFEKEFAAWQGTKYALAFNNGTSALHAAMFGCGIGIGDEIICPSITYWASVAQVFSLGGTVVFADIDPETLCIDPDSIEKRITKNTKAIMVVHYLSYPADMDRILAIAKKHNLKVIEDVSHAQGGLYKGKKLGTFGDVAAMSLMSGKSFAIGEGGILVTNDRDIYERAIAFGHYERFDDRIQNKELRKYIGLPLGGYKYRMHQLSSAVGRVQLKYYDERCAEIRKAMDYFWKQLESMSAIKPHRVLEGSGSNMAGWYLPYALYNKNELGGLSITRFTEAVRAEGVANCIAGCNNPLHTHPVFNTCDIYGHGKPTRLANSKDDIRVFDRDLPVSEKIGSMIFSVPWFKKFVPEVIEEYAYAYRKVCENYKDLLPDDKGDPANIGTWHFFKHG
ncbi:MAG TPA: DegT/DnrJ/EryC1/StrS family aminotransferase [Clostridiaceae bacterium]|nr:DegT/DnrJ/EryC1/StrS family aminotransferase [Clostridiaceae bacterium]